MKFRKTLGGLAATLSLSLASVATPAVAAVPAPALTQSAAVAISATTKAKAAPPIAPKGYFAVAVYGSLREGGKIHTKSLLRAGTAAKATTGANMYTTLPYKTRMVGHALKFGKATNKDYSENGYTFAKPQSGKTIYVEVYYFKNSAKNTVLKNLEKTEAVCGGYNKTGPCLQWYKRTTALYSIPPLGIPGLSYASAVTFIAGKTYSTKIQGKECTVKDGNYFNRTKKGNGCR